MSATSSAEYGDLVTRIKNDQDFRDKFHLKYSDKEKLLGRHIDRLKKVLEDKKIGLESTQMIKNAKITTRMKKEASAIKTLKRRQKQCVELGHLRSRLEKHGQKWEEYWARQIEPPWWKDDHKPYEDIDEMLSALPDIGGMRICVYSPEDVDKVVEYLNHLYIPDHANRTAKLFDHREDLLAKPPQIIRRGHGPDHLHELEHYINTLEKNGDMPPSTKGKELHYQDQFPGYRATHVRVQLKSDLVYDEVQLEGTHTVEIQILTVIMDTWAQVVHGLTYKPELPPTDGLRILLDQLSGIVLLGETTLTQVSRVRQDLEAKHTEELDATPDDWYELGAWLSRECKRLEPDSFSLPNATSSTPKFGKLDELLKVLRVNEAHTYKSLQILLHKAHQDHGSDIITYHLPIHLLRALAESGDVDSVSQVIDDNKEDDREVFFRRSRQMAHKVVHIINMAFFLGIGDDHVQHMHRAMKRLAESAPKDSRSKTPSMIEMLDLLHHAKPPAHEESSISKIQDFCKAFCEESCLADVVEDAELLAALELPRMLVNAGYVARPIFDDPSEIFPQEYTTVIPRDLCAFLDDEDDTHFIPEILNVAQKIAERQSRRDSDADREPTTSANGIFTRAANLTRWLNSRRMRFEAKDEEEDFFRVLVDRMEVPMRSRFDQTEGTMVLEIDKHKEQMWPHPGFFSTTVCTESEHDHCKLPRWKYIESEANNWSVKKLRDEKTSDEIPSEPSGENNFLRLFRRLHPDCAPIEPIDEDPKVKQYRFSIKNERFCLTSTPEKYILKEDTRKQSE